ncbi:hypothetical protein CDL12_20027 [Handroanthus impetiginosus]|uniref:Uncharacterized protein n=1 Tax=Handroanthus impetiginosus TaxID=429701 RepID=A0A2G9GQA1_9LAMI|nr:hypothetical protein CDL12_20027 [Handroanthus impetiginosus]
MEGRGEEESGSEAEREEEFVNGHDEDSGVSDTIGPMQLVFKELNTLIRKVIFPVGYKFVFPSPRARASNPPMGYFTIFTAYFSSGHSILLDPLLVDLEHSYGLCLSQLMPNLFIYFANFQLGLPLNEIFQSLFLGRKVLNEPFFYFFPRLELSFLGGIIAEGFWKERFSLYKIGVEISRPPGVAPLV